MWLTEISDNQVAVRNQRERNLTDESWKSWTIEWNCTDRMDQRRVVLLWEVFILVYFSKAMSLLMARSVLENIFSLLNVLGSKLIQRPHFSWALFSRTSWLNICSLPVIHSGWRGLGVSVSAWKVWQSLFIPKSTRSWFLFLNPFLGILVPPTSCGSRGNEEERYLTK